MNSSQPLRDLVVLTADKNTQFSLRGLFSRHHALGLRKVEADYYTHPEKDPGIFHKAHDYLRFALKTHQYALVFMDREGCGQEDKPREELEQHLERELFISGWKERAHAVVLDPELEIWVWSDSPHVEHELGWSDPKKGLRAWLRERELLGPETLKPEHPKEAMEAVLRQVRKPRSSAIYQNLAAKVSLTKCHDPAFLKLKGVLLDWFGK